MVERAHITTGALRNLRNRAPGRVSSRLTFSAIPFRNSSSAMTRRRTSEGRSSSRPSGLSGGFGVVPSDRRSQTAGKAVFKRGTLKRPRQAPGRCPKNLDEKLGIRRLEDPRCRSLARKRVDATLEGAAMTRGSHLSLTIGRAILMRVRHTRRGPGALLLTAHVPLPTVPSPELLTRQRHTR